MKTQRIEGGRQFESSAKAAERQITAMAAAMVSGYAA
jgi:hypothetical protein